jgi:nitroimidazol reductase NimA-like FMN-containing flavoprotein (pyridoxamine 5'-phosphate oxidase superfamily)
MRRTEKEIKDPRVLEELLESAPVCRLGLAPAADSGSRGDYPYIVPVHFAHAEGRIYIHSAGVGAKMDMLARNSRVCVEIDEYLGLIPSDRACGFGTRYRSLIAFGRARLVDGAEEKRRALDLIMKKYSGRTFVFADRELETVSVVEIRIEELSGKQAG